MLIHQTLNNNVAIAEDDNGHACVVFGKGVGFPKAPYELSDESVIRRRFYEFDESLIPMVASLPEEALTAASEIVQEARAQLNCTLNPNLEFTLADHLNFALQRAKNGMTLDNPLESEIRYVYPREVAVGRRGLDIVKRIYCVDLDPSEATAIALHLVNAEGSSEGKGDMNFTIKSTEIIDRIVALVESTIERRIDRDSYSYMRFVMHLRFLIALLLPQVRSEFPEAVACADAVSTYLKEAHGWECSDDELLYLVLHSNQFITGQ